MNKLQVVSRKSQVYKFGQYGLLLFCILHSTFHIAAAQTIKRIELEPPRDNTSFHVISLDKQGVLLVEQINRNSFSLQKYNADLNRDWSIDANIENGLDFVKSSFDGQSVYLLFSRTRTDFYQVVKVNVGPGYIENYYLSSVDKFQITDFQTLGYSVFMAGTVRDEPLLIYTNLLSKQSKVLPGVTQANSVIQSVEADTLHRVVNVCFATKKGREVRLLAKTFDENGTSIGQTAVVPDEDYSLLNGRLFIINDSTKVMVGSYGYRNMQGNSGAASQGLFLSKIVYDEVEFTKYNSFTDFQNFFGFMSERQQERIQRKIERKKENGDDLKLNYRLLVHDLIPQGDDFLVVSEVFYPEYRTNNYNTSGLNSWWGQPYSSSIYSPFMGGGLYNPYFYDPFYRLRYNNNQATLSGFIYTHAIVASFNSNGDRLWDNCLPFENYKSMDLREKVRIKLNNDQSVALSYSQNGLINSAVFAQGKVLTGKRSVPIVTEDRSDQVKRTTTDEVLHWFDDYYLAYGYQRIAGADGRRNVFYINKISF